MRGLNYRCKIGIQIGNSVRSVYCHADGEPERTGVILRDYYDTVEKANEILKNGDMTFLKETLESSNFYARDRHASFYEVEARDYDTLDQFLSVGPVDYYYLLTDNGWQVKTSNDIDSYKVIPQFLSVDDALLVQPIYVKREAIVKSPKW